jgi:transposase
VFIRVKTTPNSPRKSVQVCETQRKADKVSQTIIRHVGIAENERELEELKKLAFTIKVRLEEERARNLPLFSPDDLRRSPTEESDKALPVNLRNLREESRVIEGIGDVFCPLFDELGFSRIFDNSVMGRSRTAMLTALVLARLANPSSKLRTAALLESDFGIKLPIDRIYRLMTALHGKIGRIQHLAGNAALNLFNNKVDVMLYDVTTLYFESRDADDLRRFGFSKDCKMNEVQVVLAMATTKEGLPLTYKLFHGATFEGSTLTETLEEFHRLFNIERIICVADRGMLSDANLAWIESKGWEFVVAAKLKNLPKTWKDTVLSHADRESKEKSWIQDWQYSEKRKLVVTFSVDRQQKDSYDRDRLLSGIVKKLSSDKSTTPEKLLRNRGVKKFLSTKTQGKLVLDEQKIKDDQRWDGLYGVFSNSKLSPADIISLYKNLWHIEAAFRLNKHDLKIRPVFHWTKERIESHVAICFVAFVLATHAEYRVGLQHAHRSFEFIRNELLAVQVSIVKDISTKKLYRIPSSLSPEARAIYRCFGLKRPLMPTQL